ncbi:PH domain-containing protein [Streptomyces shenzhenensis]|uniref:PH domain-containing protein n=1 Tax=Streptomyces shenzhenensis TaxID=943815 RepID=UPI001F2A3244|nr:PH domain-containing protein [Streptomyces shenzhenensis]
MGETVFRYTRRQRLVMWAFALGMAGWAGAVCVRAARYLADGQTGSAVGLWLMFGLIPTVLFVPLAGMPTGWTRIDAEGLRTRGMTGRRRVGWRDIESIHALAGRGRNGSITQIGVTRTDGRSFLLPIPFTSGTIAEDPDFYEKLELMQREWKKCGGPGAE